MTDPVQDILSRLDGVRPAGEGRWTAYCPVHENPPNGHHRSLSASRGGDGQALLHCHGGCELPAIVSALGMDAQDLFPDTLKDTPTRGIVATYPYRDESGTLLFEVVRFEPKDFRQRRPDGNRGWTWKLDGTRRTVYHLPELLNADPGDWVFIVEGEKDVDNLATLGVAATCNAGGAGKWRDEYSDTLTGRRVCIIPDADDPGRRHAKDVARSLHGKAAEVKMLDLQTAVEGFAGKDISDWLDALDSRTPEELAAALVEMAEAGKIWTPSAKVTPVEDDRPRAALRSAASIPTRPVGWVWRGRFPLAKVSLLIGNPGGGKSTETLDMAARVSRGVPWPDGAPCETGSVILLSGEDDAADTVIPRLRAAGADLERISILEGIEWRNPDTGEVRLDLVQLDRHMSAIREAIHRTDARLLVIDPISSFVGKVDDHRNAELRGLLSALSALARDLGCAIICVSHLRKSGGLAVHQAVGSLAYTAAARAVWALIRDPEDDDRRLLLPVKMNLGRDATGLAFKIDTDLDGQPVIQWEPGEVNLRADDVLNPKTHPGRPPVEREEAAEWLSMKLANDPRPAAELLREAEADGITPGTLRRAKDEMGVQAIKAGFGEGWVWCLTRR